MITFDEKQENIVILPISKKEFLSFLKEIENDILGSLWTKEKKEEIYYKIKNFFKADSGHINIFFGDKDLSVYYDRVCLFSIEFNACPFP